MTLWALIPTCDDAMSVYTLIALCIFAVIGVGMASIAYWWTSREFKTHTEALKGHDMYIVDATVIINKIRIELAVQESSLETLKKDITEIKADVKTLLKR
jgi:hypothetical protein